MTRRITIEPLPDIRVLRTAAHRPDESDRIRRRAAAGELCRIGRGLFVDASAWSGLNDVQRHLVVIHAVADRMAPGQLVSHRSAAVVLSVPLLDGVPDRVHVTERRALRATANATFVRHADLDAEHSPGAVTTPTGIRTTGPERTAVDLALQQAFVPGVAAVDDLVARGADRDGIREMVLRRGPRGRRRAVRTIEFADPASGSPGESVLRARFDEYGTPRPVLQQRFGMPGAPDAVVDFWFPDQGVVIEFDGAVKYRDRTMRAGRTPEDVVIEEKRREDRLRAMPGVRHVLRVDWSMLWDEARLRAELRRVGIPMSR